MAATETPYWIKKEEQECLVKPKKQVNWFDSTYDPSYDKIAYDLLSTSDSAKTKAHLCRAFHCSKPTLLNWMKKNPSFKEAVEKGLDIGCSRFMDRIAKHAFEPTSNVNNGLIKLLAGHVYGVREDDGPTVVINNTVDTDPETLMKNRGIPVPQVDIEDVE